MDVSDVRTGFTKHRDDVGIRCQKLFQDFLEEFKEDGEDKYARPMAELEKMERNCLEVSLEDVEKYNTSLHTTILEEYYRVYPYLCQALANVVRDRAKEKLDKEYYVSLVDVASRVKVRELRSIRIGTLIRISGQVVRTHPVHPELISATFICLDCQTVIPGVEQQFKFTMPTICRNPVCNNRRRFDLDINKSVFVDFQKVKIQETQAELPRGSIPRSVDVILRAEIVETVQAGDRYDFTGTLIVVPDVAVLSLPGAKAETGSRHKSGDNVTDGVRGLKSLGVRDLTYKMAFMACSVAPTNARFFGAADLPDEFLTAENIKKQMTDAEWNKVYDMSRDKELYKNLVDSLFPSIYGNEQIKKGIILMLFGGVAKRTMEGTALRGDVNCIIVGDPSTAKSQLLKQVADLCPRSVYTSGKASTAAGLTAAVVKDEESADFVIEAGALLLADNGICCIDEFDKMDLHDQVAIHEAMEQQTISLAKAGVRASLNARTSILAAANPIGGRYDRTKSLQQNVTLSAPIMSRFDLFFVLLDECNEIVDYAIAERIVQLHSDLEADVNRPYTQDEVLRYILFAKQFKPIITPNAKKLLVDCYNQLRQRDVQSTTKGTWRITVRQLESLVRLSEAMAKMECSDDVLERHVEEAFSLLNKSIIRVEQPDINLDDETDAPLTTIGEEPNEDLVDDPAPIDPDDPTSEPPLQPAAPEPKKKITLSFEEYKRLTNSIVIFIRKEEERKLAEIEEAGGDAIFEGVRRGDVVLAYLESISDEIETEEELAEKKALIRKIIDRLMHHDQILVPLSQLEPEPDDGERDEDEEDRKDAQLLVVHPMYCPDV